MAGGSFGAVDADMGVWESHEMGGRGKEELLGVLC